MTTLTPTELAELAGGFSHEIKNLLGTFKLNLELLAEDFAAAESPRERRAGDRIRRLQGQCGRLVELANAFLRFVRAGELTPVPTSLADLIEELVDFYEPTARAGGVRLKLHLSAELPAVPVDRELVKQALLNLLLNAAQAMPQGGEITLLAQAEPPGVRLEVIDTGTGMPPEVMAKLFKPFFTTKPGGTGLGLPTVRKIIAAHGGEIAVESAPGNGTRFTIRLPAE